MSILERNREVNKGLLPQEDMERINNFVSTIFPARFTEAKEVVMGEDMARIQHLVDKTAGYAAAITALEKVLSFIQKERAAPFESGNLEDFFSDDAILSGVTGSIGVVNEMLANAQYCARQLLKIINNCVSTIPPEGPKDTAEVAVALEDIAQLQHFVSKIAEYVAAVGNLKRVVSFIREHRASQPKSGSFADFVSDDAILFGVTGSIGMVSEMLANTLWCVKQFLKIGVDAADSTERESA